MDFGEIDDGARKAGEIRFRRLWESDAIGILLANIDGRILDANPAFLAMIGADRTEAGRLRWDELARPEVVADMRETAAAALRTGRAAAKDREYLRRDGTPTWVLSAVSALDADKGDLIVVVADRNDRRRMEEELVRREAEARSAGELSRAILDELPVEAAILDDKGRIVSVNRAWREFADANGMRDPSYGVGSSYLPDPSRLLPDDACGHCPREVEAGVRALLSGESRRFEHEYACHGPDARRWFRMIATRLRPEAGGGVFVMHLDITEATLARERIQESAMRDALTGLPNRALFMDRVAHALERARRDPKHRFAVLFLDLDRFKNVNDSLGHLMGDRLLVLVAQRLRAQVRGADTVARLGGDEFTVLLEDLQDDQVHNLVAERIVKALGGAVDLDGNEVFVGCSVGIAVGSANYEKPEFVLRDADAAMYAAKQRGRGRVVVFDQSLHEQAMDRLRFEGELGRALDRDEFLLHYQPIVDVATGGIVAFECLLRWKRPDGAYVSPMNFVPVAEDTGLIVSIGHWVLRESCRTLAEWRKTIPDAADLAMNVNLSAKQFLDPDLLPRIVEALRVARLPGKALNLEITESVVMENFERATATLHDIRRRDVGVQLDDFGTGYSSLAYLHRFPVDALKIDRDFVRKMDAGGTNVKIVRSIVNLAADLEIGTTAEGVEEAAQWRILGEIGCDRCQGFHFAKPLDTAGATELLRAERGGNPPWGRPSGG